SITSTVSKPAFSASAATVATRSNSASSGTSGYVKFGICSPSRVMGGPREWEQCDLIHDPRDGCSSLLRALGELLFQLREPRLGARALLRRERLCQLIAPLRGALVGADREPRPRLDRIAAHALAARTRDAVARLRLRLALLRGLAQPARRDAVVLLDAATVE